MTESNIECQSSFACISENVVKQCYFDVPWSDRKNFCECSTWYGFIGENCDEVTPGVIYNRIMQVVILIWSMVLLGFLVRDIADYCWWNRSVKNQRRIQPAIVTAIFTFLGVLMIFISVCIQMNTIFNVSNFKVRDFDNYGVIASEVTISGSGVSTAALSFSVCFYLLASLQISLSWVSVADSMSIISKLPYPKFSKYFKKIIWIFQVVYITLIIILVSLSQYTLISIVTSAGGLLAAVIFIPCTRQFLSLMNNVAESTMASTRQIRADSGQQVSQRYETKPLIKPLSLIRRSSLITIILLFIIIIPFGVLGFLLPQWQDLIAFESFNYILLARDVGILLGLILFSCNLWYCRKLLKNLKLSYMRSLERRNAVSMSTNPRFSARRDSDHKSSLLASLRKTTFSVRDRRKTSLTSNKTDVGSPSQNLPFIGQSFSSANMGEVQDIADEEESDDESKSPKLAEKKLSQPVSEASLTENHSSSKTNKWPRLRNNTSGIGNMTKPFIKEMGSASVEVVFDGEKEDPSI